MKKIVKLVNMSFKNSQEYFKQSIDIQHIKAKFVENCQQSKSISLMNCWQVSISSIT